MVFSFVTENDVASLQTIVFGIDLCNVPGMTFHHIIFRLLSSQSQQKNQRNQQQQRLQHKKVRMVTFERKTDPRNRFRHRCCPIIDIIQLLNNRSITTLLAFGEVFSICHNSWRDGSKCLFEMPTTVAAFRNAHIFFSPWHRNLSTLLVN